MKDKAIKDILTENERRNASFVRHQQIPDPNALYKLRIRAKNLGTAPASNTNLIAQFAAVQDYAELTTEITASRGSASAGQGLPVLVAGGSVGVSGSITVGTMPTPTNYNVNSAATTNGANVKNAAGTIMAIAASNTSASIRYLKLYNKATAPVPRLDYSVRDAVGVENGRGLVDEVHAIDHECHTCPARLRLVHDVRRDGRLAGARGGDQHL